MRLLSNDEHDRLWHLCNRVVVEAAGARAAMLCDARDGNVLISIGETGQSGAPTGVTALGPGERVVDGPQGNVYGVDLPNDFMLAVLHDAGALEAVRAAVNRATAAFAELLLPPAVVLPEKKPKKRRAPAKKKAAPGPKAKKKKPAPPKKKARAARAKPKQKARR